MNEERYQRGGAMKGEVHEGRGAMNKLRQAAATLAAVLREIFDESAYRRFLQRSGRTSSRAAYREFLRQKQEPRARCC